MESGIEFAVLLVVIIRLVGPALAIVRAFFVELSFPSSSYRTVSFFAPELMLLGMPFLCPKMSRGAEQKA